MMRVAYKTGGKEQKQAGIIILFRNIPHSENSKTGNTLRNISRYPGPGAGYGRLFSTFLTKREYSPLEENYQHLPSTLLTLSHPGYVPREHTFLT